MIILVSTACSFIRVDDLKKVFHCVPFCSICSFRLHPFRRPVSPFNLTPFQVGAPRKYARCRGDSSWFPSTNVGSAHNPGPRERVSVSGMAMTYLFSAALSRERPPASPSPRPCNQPVHAAFRPPASDLRPQSSLHPFYSHPRDHFKLSNAHTSQTSHTLAASPTPCYSLLLIPSSIHPLPHLIHSRNLELSNFRTSPPIVAGMN